MRLALASLLIGLGAVGSLYVVREAIAPQQANAYTSRVNITVERQPNEPYETLVRRAEAVARAAAQRSFDNDILATEAEILVTGEHIGLSAPILVLTVSRENWRNRPDPRRWSTYYPNAKQLLRIDDPVAATPEPAANQRPEPTLGTGVIQTTLRWSTTDDLDLEIIDPSGQRVFFQNQRVASGGELDVDSNAGCSDTITNPVENIFWPPTGAPPGNYVVRVNLYQRCATQSGPISYRLRLLIQGQERNLTGSVDASNQTVSYPFSINPNGTPTLPEAPGGQPANPAGTPNQPTTPANPAGTPNQPTTPANPAGTPNRPATPANPSGTPNRPATPANPSGSRNPINRARDVRQQINNPNRNNQP